MKVLKRQISELKEEGILIYIRNLYWQYIENPILKYKEMWQRVFYYGWKMRWSWDFDAWTIYDVLYLKLDRVHGCMINHSHLMWNSRPDTKLMKRLCEAKHLAKKLSENYKYEHRNYSKLRIKYTSRKGKDGIFSSLHENSKVIDGKLYRFMVKKAFEKDEKEMENVTRRFHYLIEKYAGQWWD